LIKAAEKVIGRKGYAKATTDEIAREAGLTKGALYFHFKSKEDMFFGAIRQKMDIHTQFYIDFLRDDVPGEQIIKNMIHGGFENLTEKRFISFDFLQKAHKVRSIQQYLEKEQLEMRRVIVEYLRRRLKVKKRVLERLFDILHTFFEGLYVQVQAYKYHPDLPELERNLCEIVDMYLRRNRT